MNNDTNQQQELCAKYGVSFVESPDSQKVGISLNVKQGVLPLNGLRHKPEGDTTGWYIWAGTEMSENPEFFQPLHVSHLENWSPLINKFLGLPPGWRFLVSGEYEDIWFDQELLEET